MEGPWPAGGDTMRVMTGERTHVQTESQLAQGSVRIKLQGEVKQYEWSSLLTALL